MADYTKVRAELRPTGRQCRLYIDDKLVEGVTRFEIVADVQSVTRITIEQLLIEGEAGGLVDTTAIGHEYRKVQRIGDKPTE